MDSQNLENREDNFTLGASVALIEGGGDDGHREHDGGLLKQTHPQGAPAQGHRPGNDNILYEDEKKDFEARLQKLTGAANKNQYFWRALNLISKIEEEATE